MGLIKAVTLIRIGCNADPDPGSASASLRIRIQMRIRVQGGKMLPENKIKTLMKFFSIFWRIFGDLLPPGSGSRRSPIMHITGLTWRLFLYLIWIFVVVFAVLGCFLFLGFMRSLRRIFSEKQYTFVCCLSVQDNLFIQ